MNYEDKIIKVSQIRLDLKNPRFPPVSSQREAIDVMIKDQEKSIIKLAEDIYQNGINPSSKPILFRERNKLIDGDGNRRLVALKILDTPSLVDSNPRLKSQLNAILRNPGSFPKEISCVIFKNRDFARHWIHINHGGQLNGRGQVPWNPEQADRFERKTSIGLEALDQLQKKKLISELEKKQINKSTLDRLLSYKGVKSTLSISQKDNKVDFGKIEDLKKIVLSLRNVNVSKVYTAVKGIDFVNKALESKPLKEEPTNIDNDANCAKDSNGNSKERRSPRTKKSGLEVFGGNIALKKGHVNNLYRDIESLYSFYIKEKNQLSEDFIVLFRMSLRLLSETAAREENKNLVSYLTDSFDQAKKKLTKDQKTSLSNQSINKRNLGKLFNTGAHEYTNSRNEEQALAMSVLLGAIITISHGKQR